MILLDTCAIVWDALDQGQLSAKASKAIDRADQHNALIVSDISIWEIAMLIKKGRIEVDTNAANFVNLFLQSRNISVIQISSEIAELSTNFGPSISNDPADRLIAATSIIHNAQLVTADKNLIESEIVDTLW
ncbi:MAG: type II toxin-antitoxin system VapC family toxin [Cellvibrionaceae bacterium]